MDSTIPHSREYVDRYGEDSAEADYIDGWDDVKKWSHGAASKASDWSRSAASKTREGATNAAHNAADWSRDAASKTKDASKEAWENTKNHFGGNPPAPKLVAE